MTPARGRGPWTFGSGPAVATLFGRLFALISMGAWLSLGWQVRLLADSRGLLPVGEFMEAARQQGAASWWRLPTVFLWAQSDAALTAGIVAGVALSLAALIFEGVPRRVCVALSTMLYLSYATACRVFLSFQWDNLLLECGVLTACLSTSQPAPLVHFLFRALLFKLYFESGVAKWQSPLHDWQDGSAMTYYYETAPLPTWLGWYAHNLPAWWHHFESRATLAIELAVPLLIFGPRRARLAAAATFTAFQIANAATANYGFFCYLSAALNLFLLDDTDIERLRSLRRPVPPPPAPAPATSPSDEIRPSHGDSYLTVATRWAGRAGAAAFLLVSLGDALFAFGDPGPLLGPLVPVLEIDQSFRLVNTYHLFASITRQRIEPELQTLARAGAALDDDAAWTAHALWHKPGDLRRAPDFVAPHQPRVDFQLWFYGLSFRRRAPPYVSTLVERMCEDPAAVRVLFRDSLPAHPRAVRIVYWLYHFTTPAERRATGNWWRRERLMSSPAAPCPAAEAP
jgi:lipase maturation factor 1